MFKVIGTMFKWVWKAISWTRILVLNLIFLVIVFLIIGSLGNKPGLKIPNQSALVVMPFGKLVDQLTYDASFANLLTDDSQTPQETLVRELTQAIQYATNDDEITGLILRLDYLQSGGMSKIEEIGQAINEFKTSGKPVIAYADSMDQSRYLLASYADEVYLNKMGSLYLTGFGIYRNYYKNLSDKLEVDFHVFKVGDFKDAVEPFIREDMSPESREHVSSWLGEVWQRYTGLIESHRDLELGALDTFINQYGENLVATNGNASELYLNKGLIDGAPSTLAMESLLAQKFGLDKNGEHLNAVSVREYLNNPTLPKPSSDEEKIGLIVASGGISEGRKPEGSIGSKSLSELIEKARNDSELQALVIRVDSGGGSAFASEVIREQIAETNEKMPVYISMGSVAASGGYWISAPATEIWATPSTVTGSIGVFGLIPNISKSLNKAGITTDGVATSPLAGLMRIDRPMSDEAKVLIQSSVENIYTRFLELVAEARDTTPEEIHEIAQGRIWTGNAALQNGLVDELGNLHDVFEAAAEDLDLASYAIKEVKRELSPEEQFTRAILERVQFNLPTSAASKVLSFAEDSGLLTELETFVPQNSASSKPFYASCLICIAP